MSNCNSAKVFFSYSFFCEVFASRKATTALFFQPYCSNGNTSYLKFQIYGCSSQHAANNVSLRQSKKSLTYLLLNAVSVLPLLLHMTVKNSYSSGRLRQSKFEHMLALTSFCSMPLICRLRDCNVLVTMKRGKNEITM